VRFDPVLALSGLSPTGEDPVCAILETDGAYRYVRTEGAALSRIGSESGGPFRMQFAEVEIHARPNFARCAHITASSRVALPEWSMDKLLDRIHESESTSFGSSSIGDTGKNHSEFLSFDLGVFRPVREIVLFPRHAPGVVSEVLPLDVVVSLSDDHSAWRTVTLARSLYAQRGDPKVLSFPGETARSVKVEGARLRPFEAETARPYRMQFAEIEIH